MIYQVLTFTVREGQGEKLSDWRSRVSAFFKENYPEMIDWQLLYNINGPKNQITQVASYESLATMENIWEKSSNDPGWIELVKEFVEYVDISTRVDNFYRVVE